MRFDISAQQALDAGASPAAKGKGNFGTHPDAVEPDGQSMLLKGVITQRQYIDCREFPSTMNCSIALPAENNNNNKELLEAAVPQAAAVHG